MSALLQVRKKTHCSKRLRLVPAADSCAAANHIDGLQMCVSARGFVVARIGPTLGSPTIWARDQTGNE